MTAMISVVIPARNEEENIEELLRSIEKNSYDDYEVIVVDGDSEDRTPEIADEYGARVIDGPGEGLAAAQNIGWRNAEGDIIWFVDADCKLEKDSLEKVGKFFDENPDKAIGGLDVRHEPQGLIERTVSAENRANSGKRRLFDWIEEKGKGLGVIE